MGRPESDTYECKETHWKINFRLVNTAHLHGHAYIILWAFRALYFVKVKYVHLEILQISTNRLSRNCCQGLYATDNQKSLTKL